MITPANQRWREHRASYRPAGEVINTSQYEVASIAGDAVARGFVEAHHYSATYPAARFRFGLYRGTDLVGVAVFSHPAQDKVLTNVFPGEVLESVELGRFILLDDVPGNGETYFLARCFDGLRRDGIRGVVSFSDPVPRTTAKGVSVFLGHVGTIYQAHNAVYLGRASSRALRLLPDGRVFSARAISKVRARECGSRYAAAQLEEFGAAPFTDSTDAREWLAEWLPKLTRRLPHAGNFKYAWGLDRTTKRSLPASLAYPKMTVRP